MIRRESIRRCRLSLPLLSYSSTLCSSSAVRSMNFALYSFTLRPAKEMSSFNPVGSAAGAESADRRMGQR